MKFWVTLSSLCLSFFITIQGVQASTLEDFLQKMAAHSRKTASLQAEFIQSKKLSFLQNPLQSQGHLFFTKDYAKSGKPALLWEYLQPAPSGMLFQNNEGWLWMQERSTLQKAQGYEGNVLNAMLKQMLLWFVFEPENLKKHYTIQLQDSKSTDKKQQCMLLLPKDASFFTSLTICVDTTSFAIVSLEFQEAKGDNTTLFFKNTKINAPYPTAFPDGTPFP